MQSRLIVNPVAGTDLAADYLPLINRRLRERVGAMDIVLTVAEGDAVTAAQQAVAAGYEQLFVAGGDGTLNEVINGIGMVRGGFEQTVVGIIPLGTGNDFATEIGIPSEIDAALDWLAEAVVVRVDLGVLGDRHFINVSGGGFIAEVSEAVDPQLKTIAGKLAYLIGGAQVLMTYEGAHATLLVEGAVGDLPATESLALHAFAVCNAPMIGGGRLIAPTAIINDGLLDICLIESMPTLEFVALLRRVSSGDHVDDRRVHYFRATGIELQFDRTIKVNTDGQVLEADHCRYRILPRAARLLAHPGNADSSSLVFGSSKSAASASA